MQRCKMTSQRGSPGSSELSGLRNAECQLRSNDVDRGLGWIQKDLRRRGIAFNPTVHQHVRRGGEQTSPSEGTKIASRKMALKNKYARTIRRALHAASGILSNRKKCLGRPSAIKLDGDGTSLVCSERRLTQCLANSLPLTSSQVGPQTRTPRSV